MSTNHRDFTKERETAARARSKRTKKAPQLIKIQPSKGKNRAHRRNRCGETKTSGSGACAFVIIECESRRCSAPGRRLRRAPARAPSGPRGRQGMGASLTSSNMEPTLAVMRSTGVEFSAMAKCGVDAAPIRLSRESTLTLDSCHAASGPSFQLPKRRHTSRQGSKKLLSRVFRLAWYRTEGLKTRSTKHKTSHTPTRSRRPTDTDLDELNANRLFTVLTE